MTPNKLHTARGHFIGGFHKGHILRYTYKSVSIHIVLLVLYKGIKATISNNSW